MSKNLGPLVSGYLDPTGRGWETVVFQAGKPVLDKELELQQDVDIGAGQVALRKCLPSGWVSDDFLTSSSSKYPVFSPASTPNEVHMPPLQAHVNGWLFPVNHTNATDFNAISIGVPPVALGARRTDLIILEVWRRLVSASPSTVGKSALGRIWQNGNVKTNPADDAALNFADDLLDANVGAETTKRVQVQYRLRAIQGIDIFAYPYGMGDPAVVAHSVPAAAASPDGVATAFTYANQTANGDPGLWRAGDGDPANTLGTVDGYIYALPLMAIFRRNSAGFDRRLNQNGGVLAPNVSDRPDGLLSDIIDARDIVDLRMGSLPSLSLPEVLEKNVNFLFDNNLYTEWGTTSPFGGGCEGATLFVAEEIGLSDAHGGDGIVTGTTGAGHFVGEFDAVRRRFSGRSLYETTTVAIAPPVGGWVAGATVTIDPTALAIYPYVAFNWASFAPAQAVLHDIVGAWWIGGAAGKKTLPAMAYFDQVEGFGTLPAGSISIKIGAIGGVGLSNETLYVDLLIAFPPNGGLARTPTGTFGPPSYVVNNPAQLPAAAPVSFDRFRSRSIDMPRRGVQLEYQTVALTITQAADTTGVSDSFRMPERAAGINSVAVNGVPVAAGATIDPMGRTATFNDLTTTNPGDVLTIEYVAVRPLPQNGEQMCIYYTAQAPQAARSALLGTSLTVVPRLVSPHVYVITTGAGSQDEGYPFPFAYVQTGGIYPTSIGTYTGETELAARADVSVSEFSAATGFLKLPTFIPMVANPDALSFLRDVGDIDIEGRSYFKTVPYPGYVPNAYAQGLSNPKRHKVVLPLLAELTSTSPLGYPGQLVLVLLIRYAFDATNGVAFDFDATQNTTVASVFRIKGNLLNKRAI